MRPGEYGRTHLLSLVNGVRGAIVARGLLSEAELDEHMGALAKHLGDPQTVVVRELLVQGWGRTPA